MFSTEFFVRSGQGGYKPERSLCFAQGRIMVYSLYKKLTRAPWFYLCTSFGIVTKNVIELCYFSKLKCRSRLLG